MWFYYWLENANSSVDWKTGIQLYLQNLYYWLQNTIKLDYWILCKNRVFDCNRKTRRVTRCLQYLQNASHVRHTNGQDQKGLIDKFLKSPWSRSDTFGLTVNPILFKDVYHLMQPLLLEHHPPTCVCLVHHGSSVKHLLVGVVTGVLQKPMLPLKTFTLNT